VLSDGNLQLEVMKHEPINIEVALSHAIKVELYEQSLVCQGTLASDHDENCAKCQTCIVYAVILDLLTQNGLSGRLTSYLRGKLLCDT